MLGEYSLLSYYEDILTADELKKCTEVSSLLQKIVCIKNGVTSYPLY